MELDEAIGDDIVIEENNEGLQVATAFPGGIWLSIVQGERPNAWISTTQTPRPALEKAISNNKP